MPPKPITQSSNQNDGAEIVVSTGTVGTTPNKKGKELTPSVRGQIVGMRKANLTYSEIARILEIPKSTVRGTIQKHESREDDKTRSRSGRPKTFSDENAHAVVAVVKQHPQYSYKQIIEATGMKMSPSTIRKILQDERVNPDGYMKQPPPAVPAKARRPTQRRAASKDKDRGQQVDQNPIVFYTAHDALPPVPLPQ